MAAPVVTTDRIALVPLEADDREELLAAVAASRDLHHPWIDAADTPRRFADVIARSHRDEFHPFVVRARDSGALAGAINVSNIVSGPFRSAFVGYWAFAGHEGRGYLSH